MIYYFNLFAVNSLPFPSQVDRRRIPAEKHNMLPVKKFPVPSQTSLAYVVKNYCQLLPA